MSNKQVTEYLEKAMVLIAFAGKEADAHEDERLDDITIVVQKL